MTFDYKLKPTKPQIQQFEIYLETCKKVYNYALRERKDWVNSRKSSVNACSIHSEYIISPDPPRPTYNSQCKSLTEAKKQYSELTIPHSQVLQQTLRTLEAAFVNSQLHGKLKLLQRRLKNKKKGSNNWRNLQAKIARLYQKIHSCEKGLAV